jgi:Holliday junction resolvase RusA-like endonuclease
VLEFVVAGIPAPQGSKRVFVRGGRVSLVESCARVKPYRALVSLAASQARTEAPTQQPVGIAIAFVFVRPKSHYTSKGELRAGAPSFPGKPDVDKLCRAVLDALTGILYHDDAQVVSLSATKRYGVASMTAISLFTV